MNEWQAARNRRIVGMLLAIRNTSPGQYDPVRLFEERAHEFLATENTAAFSMLLAAQMVGDASRAQRGFGPTDLIGLGLPAAAEEDPDIVAAFRLVVVLMNHDLGIATALIHTITQSRSRSRNVLACLIGMLTEAPALV